MAKSVTKAAPDVTRVLFENDRVRVVELNVKKGSKADEHTHPDYFAYAITPFAYTSTGSSGKTQSRNLKPSDVDWHDGESHSVKFTKSGRALIVELK